jgi:hypothetical protein
MQILAYPPITPPTATVDLTEVNAKIDQLKSNETADDATVATLDALVKAIPAAPDLTPYAKSADVDAKNTAQDAAIAKVGTDAVTPIYEPVPTPVPLVLYKSSYVAKDNTGTLLVNQGATHTALRTNGPKIALNSEQVFVVSAAFITTASVKIRFAILTAKVGTLLIELDSAPALTASGDGTAWVSASPSMVVRTDGLWSWFEIVVPSGQNDVYVRYCVPPGVIGAPCIYEANAVTSLFSSVLLGMRLKADARTLDYRPSELAKNPKWFPTLSSPTTGFKRQAPGPLTSLTFDFNHPLDPLAIQTYELTDFVTGFSASGFYGGVAKFINVTTPNGSLVRLLVAVYPTNEFLLNCMQQAAPNNIQGKIRNVIVNGVAV